MSIRILLVDDHRMMRDGLRSLLEKYDQLCIVGEADTGRIAIDQARKLEPDIIIMDISMPDLNGIEATRRITAESPDIKVIALSMHGDRRYARRALDAGASGYVVKGAAADELIRAVEAAHDGKYYLSPEVTQLVVTPEPLDRTVPEHGLYDILGQREREVLQLLAEGQKSAQIGEVLNISARTVDVHRRNIMKRLDIHSVAELTKFAVREGLTRLEH